MAMQYFNPNGEMKRLYEKKPANDPVSSQNNQQADALATLLIQVGIPQPFSSGTHLVSR
jgi:hypothetical protein